MGVFQLPQSLCHDLSAMVARFWWVKAGNKSIYTGKVGENNVGPKCFGGLGFKNFKAFNKAMVGKQEYLKILILW
ncbi:unnamed protein product [Prunus brigantina]